MRRFCHGVWARGNKQRYPVVVRIGVISDTHGLVRPEALSALRGSDHLLHAGDIGGEDVLAALAELAPLTAVAGNVDGFRCGKAGETARVVLDGVRFFLTHILDRPHRPRPEVIAELRREPADVVVFGHSHLPHDEVLEGVRYFNPASAGPRRFSLPVSIGILEVRLGRVVGSRFVALDARSETALQRRMNQLSRS
jgi:putative phosphoesterase